MNNNVNGTNCPKYLVRGQGLVEYIALTALVAVVCIGTVKVFGSKVTRQLNSVSNKFDQTIRKGLNTKVANPDPFRDDQD
ncbi:MAG TPA: hypothetical protein PLH57_09215 [Oligoflexia bacterium]|nr:hypothetical protein [Oligoflexia bacterium]